MGEFAVVLVLSSSSSRPLFRRSSRPAVVASPGGREPGFPIGESVVVGGASDASASSARPPDSAEMKTRSIVYSLKPRRGIRGISVYSKGVYTGWFKVFVLSQQVTGIHEWLSGAQLAEFKRHPAMARLQNMLIMYGSDWLRQQGQRALRSNDGGVKVLDLDDWVMAAEAEIAQRTGKSVSGMSPTSQVSQSPGSIAQVEVQERNGRPDEPE